VARNGWHDVEALKLDIVRILDRAGLARDDRIVSRAVALYQRKNIPLNHILAETLIAHYLRSKGFREVDIEKGIGKCSCDVYGVCGRLSLCVEVEFNFVPPKHVVSWDEYIVARHIKKVLSVVSSGVSTISFAYPKYVVPPIPLELLRPPSARSSTMLSHYISIARKYFSIDVEKPVEILRQASVFSIMIFDVSTGCIKELSPQSAEVLITLYNSFLA